MAFSNRGKAIDDSPSGGAKAALVLGLVLLLGPVVLAYQAVTSGFDEILRPGVPAGDEAQRLAVHTERYLLLRRIGRVAAPLGLVSFGVGTLLLVRARRLRGRATPDERNDATPS